MIYEDIAKEIGNRIKTNRIEKNLTLEELGEIIGVTKSTVLKYENGNIKKISNEKLKTLSAALGVTLIELMPEYWLSQKTFKTNMEKRELLKRDIANIYGDSTLKLLEKTSSLTNEGVLKLIDRADELLEVKKYNQQYYEFMQDETDDN